MRAPIGRSVIRKWDVPFELFCQQSQESFGLSEWKVKDHADRQGCLNRDVRVNALAADLPLAGASPAPSAASESQTARLPRLRRPASSGHRYNNSLKSLAMQQRAFYPTSR